MKANSLTKLAGALFLSAFIAGSALAGPAYPSMFPVKAKPVKTQQAEKCPMMKDKVILFTTSQPRPHATTGKLAPRCTKEMMSACMKGDHSRC